MEELAAVVRELEIRLRLACHLAEPTRWPTKLFINAVSYALMLRRCAHREYGRFKNGGPSYDARQKIPEAAA